MSGGASPRKTGALAALALHALVGLALLNYEPARSALVAAAPIMVDLITPPRVEPRPDPPVEMPPKPKPVARLRPKPPEPLPVITAVEAPSPIVAPAPPPEPPATPEPPALPAVVAPAPAPVPVTPPLFNADYLRNPPPAYPPLSRRLGEEGRVVLRVLVSPGGEAAEVQLRSSSGYARLDEAAREIVRRWKFVPAKRGEHPVAAWVLIPVSFKLEG